MDRVVQPVVHGTATNYEKLNSFQMPVPLNWASIVVRGITKFLAIIHRDKNAIMAVYYRGSSWWVQKLGYADVTLRK